MEAYYVLLPIALTSVVLGAVATRVLGARRAALRPALGRMVEVIGLALVLAAANLGTGFLVVLALRRLTGTFVSLYMNLDATLLGLSVLQAVVLQWWLREDERE